MADIVSRVETTADSFPSGGGDMGERIRKHDWSTTPLGPSAQWTEGLRTAVRIMLTATQPVLILWGKDHICLYNDACATFFAAEGGPMILGAGTANFSDERWRGLGARADEIMRGEEQACHVEQPFLLAGSAGGGNWTCLCSPIDDIEAPTGIGGVIVWCTPASHDSSGERQFQFRVEFDQRLRDLVHPREVMAAASEHLGRYMRVGRCGYAELDETGAFAVIEADWTDGLMPSAVGRHRIDDFGSEFIEDYMAGRVVRVNDALNDPRVGAETGAAHLAAGGIRSHLTVPLVRDGRFAAALFLHDRSPRRWTDHDEALVRVVADRVWQAVERARTQAELREGRAMLDFTLESARVGDWDLDLVHDKARRSLRHDQCFGYSEPLAEWGFDHFIRHVHPDDRDEIERKFREAVTELKDWHFQCRVVWPDRSVHWIAAHGSIYRTLEGKATRMLGIVSDITEQKRAEILQAAQTRVLELTVLDAPLGEILADLVRTIEDQSSAEMLGSILLLDRDGRHLRHGAAPSLPEAYNRAIDGTEIGPNVGSCGTAAFTGKPVYVSDIATDPRWADFRELALSHELRACWSTPIMSAQGEVLGTFAMYYNEPREPASTDLELVDVTIRSAGLIIERKAAEAALRESEARFNFALDASSAVGTWDWDIKKDRVFADARFAELFSVDAERVTTGAPVAEFIETIHADDRDRVGEEIRAAIDAAGPFRSEYRLQRPDGSVRWVLAKGRAYNDDAGNPARFPGVAIDITERKKSEARGQALVTLTDRWRDVSNPAELAYVAAEVLGTTLDVSRVGYGTIDPRNETVTIDRDWNAPGIDSLAGTLHFRDYGSYIDDLKRGETVVFTDAETDPRTADNAQALIAISAQSAVNMPVFEQGSLVALLYLNNATARDWSAEELALIREVAERTRTAVERNRGAAALRESESRFRSVAEAMPGFVWTADANGMLDYASTRWQNYSGATDEETLGAGWAAFIHPDDHDSVVEIWQNSIRSKTLYEAEFRLRRRDNVYRWWLVRAVPVRGDDGEIGRWIGSAADIDDIVQAREVLARSREELQQLIEERTAERDRMWRLSSDLMAVATLDGSLIAINPAWERLLGWSENDLLERGFLDLIHPDDVERTIEEVGRLSEGHSTSRFENRYRGKDGAYRTLSWVASPEEGFIHASARDVTEEKAQAEALRATEEQLRQAQKMEAVGQLTGGIAHDFNNMLAVVVGSLDLLSRRIDAGDARARRYVDAAADGAKRAAALTQRLLAFSRQQPLRPERVEANRIVTGMSDLLRRSLGADIRLETVLAGGLWRVHADPNQLENVILNLAVNARDAMPDGGRLTIETQNTHLDERYVSTEVGVTAGQYVLIAVTDTGVGMAADVIAKAFDPFFTTKIVGKGTGLGLSQVYGFVKQSGGHVKIYSEIDQGTTIKIYLPRLIGNTDDAPQSDAPPDLPLGSAAEVVLVVEDEAAVREFSVEALEELGYRVFEADGAEMALRVLEAHPEIVLLFTDVVMPDVNGAKLADEARRRHPGLKVLFTTGYTRNAIVHNGVLDPGVDLIGKPFSIEDLAKKVREVLDGS